ANVAAAARFVSTQGDDNNACDQAIAPCRTLAHALSLSVSGDAVYMAGGVYKESNTLTDFGSLTILGGYNETFSSIVADNPTVLTAKKARALGFLFPFSGVASVQLYNLTFRKAFAFDAVARVEDVGGGLLVRASGTSSINVIVNACSFEGNKGAVGGGAALLTEDTASMTGTIVDSHFSKNKASFAGGGLGIMASDDAAAAQITINHTVFEENSSVALGGAVVILT